MSKDEIVLGIVREFLNRLSPVIGDPYKGIPEHITSTNFSEICTMIYGNDWRKGFCKDTGYSHMHSYRFENGEQNVEILLEKYLQLKLEKTKNLFR